MQFEAEQFERNRTYLRTVAERILGSPSEADDAVQEAWLRVSRADVDAVENMRGWLTTIVSRICLDMLRSRRARREDLVDDWSFELDDAVSPATAPEAQALEADAVGVALLVVLDRLAPAERLAFVLHDMFGVPFDEIAPVVERSPAATRQLASRARRRVRGLADSSESAASDLAAQRRVVEAFLAASREGDFDGLMAVLDPEIEFRANMTNLADPMPVAMTGGAAVADRILARGSQFAHLARLATVGGRPGIVVATNRSVLSLLAMTIEDGRVKRLDVMVFPAAERPRLSSRAP
jgi:RNA polymerase sigma-70 factor (ECF subfamily)